MWRSRVAYPTSVIWGGRSARPTTRSCVTSIITTWSSHWRVCCASPQSLAVHAQWRIAPRLCARCALSLRRKRRFVAPRKLWTWLQCSLRCERQKEKMVCFPPIEFKHLYTKENAAFTLPCTRREKKHQDTDGHHQHWPQEQQQQPPLHPPGGASH